MLGWLTQPPRITPGYRSSKLQVLN
ncbi:hypothetical protein G8768_20335 [Pseudoteredinibacter isoporae]|nr:hypothetical protein [Pseudoteredinibacter isoporae]NIB22419.1 hypothetical protein [Pseudoteredinibacter isoporae]